MLDLPKPQWSWVLDTDASGAAIAGVLQQKDESNNYRVVAYGSRALTEGEQKWSIRELEVFAIVWSILHYAEYLRNQTFTVRTDHESLKWLWKTDNKRIARWALALQEFSFQIEYRRGKTQCHVDIFTRVLPITPLEDTLTDRIAARASLFKVEPVAPTSLFDPPFPAVDDFKCVPVKELA